MEKLQGSLFFNDQHSSGFIEATGKREDECLRICFNDRDKNEDHKYEIILTRQIGRASLFSGTYLYNGEQCDKNLCYVVLDVFFDYCSGKLGSYMMYGKWFGEGKVYCLSAMLEIIEKTHLD